MNRSGFRNCFFMYIATDHATCQWRLGADKLFYLRFMDIDATQPQLPFLFLMLLVGGRDLSLWLILSGRPSQPVARVHRKHQMNWFCELKARGGGSRVESEGVGSSSIKIWFRTHVTMVTLLHASFEPTFPGVSAESNFVFPPPRDAPSRQQQTESSHTI